MVKINKSILEIIKHNYAIFWWLTVTERLGIGNSCWVDSVCCGVSDKSNKREITATLCFKTNWKKIIIHIL